jgi:hypothetical protein
MKEPAMEQVLDITIDATDTLELLGRRLAARGYLVMLDTGSAHPRLELLDRTRRTQGAAILCEHGVDGWWLWWAWAERIAPAGDLACAVAVIDGQLRSDAA